MPLHDVSMDDIETASLRTVLRTLSAVKAVSELPRREILANFTELETARDRLSQILDKAEGK